MASTLKHSAVSLRPDPSRTVIRPFVPGDPAAFASETPRVRRIAERVRSLSEAQSRSQLDAVIAGLSERHRNVEALLKRRYEEVLPLLGDGTTSDSCAMLIGAYLCEEYSFEAAALFNPSIVAHIDQSGLPEGRIRFAMSLRGIGEGHVSSVTFRSGTWGPTGEVEIDPLSDRAVPPQVLALDDDDKEDSFWLVCDDSQELSETVLFPVAPSQKQGIEDVRLVNFTEEDGSVRYLGTYTAFSGSATRSELLQAESFNRFLMRSMHGVIAETKGTALFPRRVNGQYTMLGRQDNESIWLLQSDSLTEWNDAAKLVSPRFPWEFIQMGNCGSPIEIDEGWLVLTHGVGMVRNYCLGACLLDKADPSKVLARTPKPILRPSPEERAGYVPNVVYSCGGLVFEDVLLLPYGVADNFTSFATIPVADLLALME
ncbi:glycosidase [Sphingomonas aracearum]|uniref:Glycosidase n=1 Tax=Sphingomonas aracearum TaxID=2283317 RepID=A0A369VXP9_9SPHN|nr:glycosidase [Sphingomonas aracearum]RDE07088.1 glycosidase [Sphingomonas aracearum]